MSLAPTDYSHFSAKHENLLDQYAALIRFKQGVYESLAMRAMVSTLKVKEALARGIKVSPVSVIISEACELAAKAGITDDGSVKAIKRYLKSVASSARRLGRSRTGRSRTSKSPSEKVIDAAITNRRTEIEGDLAQIPSSIDKARAALAHEILLEGDDGPPDALCVFGVEESRRRFKDSIARRRQDLLSGKAMQTSARGYEPYWYTSYLRYYEIFEPKDARELLLSEAREFGDEVRQFAATVHSGGENAAFEFPRFVDLMVAYARCRTVRHVLLPIARRATPSVLRLQRRNGAWSDWSRGAQDKGPPSLVDDAGTTSGAILFFARYGSAEEAKDACTRGQRWLVGAQAEDGSWSSTNSGSPTLPISTTTQVLEALRYTDMPSDHPSIARGERFLLQHQRAPGLWWEKSGLWETHLTAQVVEYFQSRAERPGTLNSYLASARSLLLKSEQLVLSEDYTDGPLATVAAYHGLEHFLYGCLLHMDSDELIHADAKGTTIGFNAAFGAFERTLKERAILAKGSRLPYRQQLQHLGAKRDMFIHRAETISVADAFGFVSTCRAFVQRYDLAVLGFRLYE
ncbi:MAG: hypothetical protein JSR66_13190 [Proteobacteria bacterium]|nr:hypothetical protein [Pseudomonadota bacterium]